MSATLRKGHRPPPTIERRGGIGIDNGGVVDEHSAEQRDDALLELAKRRWIAPAEQDPIPATQATTLVASPTTTCVA